MSSLTSFKLNKLFWISAGWVINWPRSFLSSSSAGSLLCLTLPPLPSFLPLSWFPSLWFLKDRHVALLLKVLCVPSLLACSVLRRPENSCVVPRSGSTRRCHVLSQVFSKQWHSFHWLCACFCRISVNKITVSLYLTQTFRCMSVCKSSQNVCTIHH